MNGAFHQAVCSEMTSNTNPQTHDFEALFESNCEEENVDEERRPSGDQSPTNTAQDSPLERRNSWTLFFQEQYEQSVQEDGGLDKELRDMKSSQSDFPSDNVYGMPVLALLRSWAMTLAVSLVSITALAFLLSDWLPSMQTHNEYHIYRFTASGSVAIANSTTFAIITKCGKLLPSNQTISGSSVTLAFPDPVPITGWGYTLSGTGGTHPKEWTLEGRGLSDAEFSRLEQMGRVCKAWKVMDASKSSAEFFFRSETGGLMALVSPTPPHTSRAASLLCSVLMLGMLSVRL